MSLVPYLFSDLLDVPTIYDQHFGLGLSPLDFRQTIRPYRGLWRSPLQQLNTLMNATGASIINDKDSFKVNVDVQQFRPDELTVKVVDNYIVIEGKHEERGDEHGYVSRQFKRRYLLPKEVDEKQLTSSLSSDGVLQLTAPKKASPITGERSIPITQTNQPALKSTSTQEQQKQSGEKNES